MNKAYKLFYITALLATPAAHSLDATLEKGYDSNPYKLSAPPYGASYAALQLNHDGKHRLANKSSFNYRFNVDGKWYDGKAQAADSLRADARLRWANRFKIGDKTANLLLTTDLRSDSNSYFSQLQRQIATTSRGDSLEDRFNYDSAKLAAELIYRFDRQKSLSLHSYMAQRNYRQDYQQLNIESLDFTEYNLQPTFRYKSNSGFYLRPFVYLRYRYYDQLLNDDSDGRNIAGSPLTYRMFGYGVVASQRVADNLSVKAYINGYWARDNALGYRDLDYHKWELGIDYRLQGDSHIAVKSICYSKDYLQDSARVIEAETGDAGRKRTGCYLEGVYRQPFNIDLGDHLKWQLKVTNAREDNSEQPLSYRRSTLSLGLHYSF